MAFCTPYFEKYSPIVYSPPHLIATENAKPHPLLKKYLSPICTKKRFQGPCFNTYLHHVYKYPLTYKDKKQPFYRAILDLFTFCLRPRCAIAHLIATGKAKVQALSKNISYLYEFLRGCWQPFLGGFNYRPHLIGQKDGKIPPLLKTFLTYIHEIAVLYTLFSKIFSLRLHLSSNRTKNNLILPLKRKIFCPSPIRIKTGFWKGVLRNDLQFVYRNRPCK